MLMMPAVMAAMMPSVGCSGIIAVYGIIRAAPCIMICTVGAVLSGSMVVADAVSVIIHISGAGSIGAGMVVVAVVTDAVVVSIRKSCTGSIGAGMSQSAVITESVPVRINVAAGGSIVTDSLTAGRLGKTGFHFIGISTGKS